MILNFKKYKDKASTLSCTRSDGSICWTQLRPNFEDHDLAHYAVETILGYKEAFYGLVDQGYEIGDFELPREQRPVDLLPHNLPLESLQTEHMVNLLMIEHRNSGDPADYIKTLSKILSEKEIPFPKGLNEESLQNIRSLFHQLAEDWLALPPGEVMELPVVYN